LYIPVLLIEAPGSSKRNSLVVLDIRHVFSKCRFSKLGVAV